MTAAESSNPQTQLLRLHHISPVRYLKNSSLGGAGYSSQKIRNFAEDYNSGYLAKRMPSLHKQQPLPVVQDYRRKKLNQSIWVASTKRKLQARNFLPEEDKQARRRARLFLNKIRELGLVELPKISYFDEMIRQSCKKEEPKPRRYSNRSVMSRLSVAKTEDNEPETKNERFQHLKHLLDDYERSFSPNMRTDPY